MSIWWWMVLAPVILIVGGACALQVIKIIRAIEERSFSKEQRRCLALTRQIDQVFFKWKFDSTLKWEDKVNLKNDYFEALRHRMEEAEMSPTTIREQMLEVELTWNAYEWACSDHDDNDDDNNLPPGEFQEA